MYKPKIRKLYVCPICEAHYTARIERVVDANMRTHFPNTYGRGLLLCTDCLPARLAQLKKV